MKSLRLLALAALLLAASFGAALAQGGFDGLTPLGPSHDYKGSGSATLSLRAFQTKYQEKVVGMYFADSNRSVHFYMNAATWDRMKQQLIKLRDQWETLGARELDIAAPVNGYRIGNQSAVLRLAIQGATDISPKMLLLTATGGAQTRQSVTVAVSNEALAGLVEDFDDIDAAARAGK